MLRPAGLLLASLAGMLVLAAAHAPPAAAGGDRVDRLTVDYRLGTDGVLQVTETWEWTFAPGSTRSGMVRALLVREPDPQEPRYDLTYRIHDVQVADGVGNPVEHSTETRTEPGGRVVREVYRIGDSGHRSGPVTYRLNYRVATVVRGDREDGYDEFAWWSPDAPGRPVIDTLRITTRIPGGTDRVDCQLRGPGERGRCASLAVDTDQQPARIEIVENDLDPADALHLSVLIEPGVITDNELTRRWQVLPPRSVLVGAGVVVLLLAVLSAAVVVTRRSRRAVSGRRRGRRERSASHRGR